MIAERIARSFHLTLACAILALIPGAHAEPNNRLALVVGNSAYHVGPLKNPANDARDMAQKLRQLGFDVVVLQDVGFKRMVDAFQDFARRAPDYDVRLVYYAGHGIRFKGSNYLIPVDADLKDEAEISRQTFRFDHLVERLAKARGGVNIYILDACRHNPFSNIIAFGRDGIELKLRGLQWQASASPVIGLAPPRRTPSGSFVAFSTTPGQLSSDNPAERNSVYAKHLLRHIDSPGLTLDDMFRRVRKAVMDETQDQQVPWEQTSLVEPFCFRRDNERCGM